MNIDLDDYVAGGYLLTQYIDAIDINLWMRKYIGSVENLLPDKILSIGMCGTKFAPLADRTGATDKDYVEFGIPQTLVEPLNDWANPRFDKELGYPDTFFYLLTAHEYIRQFIPEPRDLQLLGIGLHKDDIPVLDEIEKLNPAGVAPDGVKMVGFAGCGFAEAVRRGDSPRQGEILGYDVIACRYQVDHSWHCSGLAKEGLEKFHFRPNRYGLIDEKTCRSTCTVCQ